MNSLASSNQFPNWMASIWKTSPTKTKNLHEIFCNNFAMSALLTVLHSSTNNISYSSALLFFGFLIILWTVEKLQFDELILLLKFSTAVWVTAKNNLSAELKNCAIWFIKYVLPVPAEPYTKATAELEKSEVSFSFL